MKRSISFHAIAASKSRGLLLSIGLLIVFVVATLLYWGTSSGDDLSSGYIACHLIATGNQDIIYSHNSTHFHIVDNPVWQAAADESGFTGFLHPYVQIPLWAASLQPLCMSMKFETFNYFFVLVIAISIAGMTWLSANVLTQFKVVSLPITALLLWLWFSHPFNYTLFLTQTHPLFLLATLGSVVLAERHKERSSGILLAFAAIIKITPALLLIYWALNKKWKAIVWFFITVLALLLMSLSLTNIELNMAFLSELKRISNILLVSWNNESLAAFIMGYNYPSEILDWRMFPLPNWLKLTGAGAALCSVALAGCLRRFGGEEGATVSIALVGMTAFTPIAWSHYYIILLVPLAYLMGQAVIKPVLWGIIAIIVLLTLNTSMNLFRPYFFAAMIAMVSCITLSVLDIRQTIIFKSRSNSPKSNK